MSEYPVISEEAKEAAEKEVNRWLATHAGGAITIGEFVQLAITAATEKLTKENELLRQALFEAQNGKYGSQHYFQLSETLSARIKELEAENKKMFEL